MNILAVSGSLRRASSNSALLGITTAMAPPGMSFTFYEGLGELPHFNPDIDTDDAPAPVAELRSRLRTADAVLICTPEYANGVPGSLKNALDWIVSSGEFMGKPAGVISASPHLLGGEKAHDSLLLTLRMMDAKIPEGATLKIGSIGLKLSKDGVLKDPDTESALRSVLEALAGAVERG
ncbi:NAD(P)H-dependent oxidoreductase [Paenibacillus filicis]|uniref:NAD(P)H-dependent oxidoreductase n=1 Tax=Paenibacillus gyeongsangnamensis TaxID=3388067 RepID=A0ABT4QH62_9BACL|nr:NADPH-dependent FMN reductase [Paenibacillus filicis]MCZ8516191.1 NAD(P)H-dependent oxidoreductase [Paenibacillus filicis]